MIRATKAITLADIRRVLPRIPEGLSEYGFTAAMNFGNPIATEAADRAAVQLDQQGLLPLRLSLMYIVNTPELARTAAQDSHRYAKAVRSTNVWVTPRRSSGIGPCARPSMRPRRFAPRGTAQPG